MVGTMTGSCQMARLIRITLKEGKEGLLYATSPELKGLLVAGKSVADLEAEDSDCYSGNVRSVRRESIGNPRRNW